MLSTAELTNSSARTRTIEKVTIAPQISPGRRAPVTATAPPAMMTWVLKLRSLRQAATIPEVANDSRDKKGWFFMTSFLLPLSVTVAFGVATYMAAAAESRPEAPTGLMNGVASAAPAVKSRFRRVMLVVLENASYDEAAKQPFLASLGRRGGLLSNVTAEAHPSQPNYLALVAGSTFGVRSDHNVDLDASQLGDLLEAKGL